jgi:von Willebrand factor type A domain
VSLGSLGEAFGKYVGGLRKVGLDVAIVVDATGSMQNIVDQLKRKLADMVDHMQRLVPGARIGAVAFRDRDDDKVATAPRQSEPFVVKWTDLTFNPKKVQSFLNGIVAEGGGDWEEAVKEGVDAAIGSLKWREDAKKVIIIVGSSPPHKNDMAGLQQTVRNWRARGGVVSTIDVSALLHEEHERRMNKWLYGDEPRTISPLPEFYQELKQAFAALARDGGGDNVALSTDSGLARHILVLAFGPQWQAEIGKATRGL